MYWFPRANDTAAVLGRRLFRVWPVGSSLWIIGCSALVYDAYQKPYDLWLFLDPDDDEYRQCWPKVPRADQTQRLRRGVELNPDQLWYEAPWQTTARISLVAACYRELNRVRQTTTRLEVLKQGIRTIVVVPSLALVASYLFLIFTSHPRRSAD